MLKYSEINGAYLTLWERFKAVAEEAGLVTKAFQGNGFVATNKDKKVTVSAFIYLPEWPYKAVSDKKKIHILLQSRETYDLKTSEIISSTVQIGYFDIGANKEVTSLLQLHYDFETPVAIAHPVFHVQLGTTKWPEDKCMDVRFPNPNEIIESSSLYSNARIPTPHMGFGAALLALAADHFNHLFYEKFLKELRQNESVKWQASCKSMRDSFSKNGRV